MRSQPASANLLLYLSGSSPSGLLNHCTIKVWNKNTCAHEFYYRYIWNSNAVFLLYVKLTKQRNRKSKQKRWSHGMKWNLMRYKQVQNWIKLERLYSLKWIQALLLWEAWTTRSCEFSTAVPGVIDISVSVMLALCLYSCDRIQVISPWKAVYCCVRV